MADKKDTRSVASKVKSTATDVAKKVVNVAIKPAEVALNVANRVDSAIHNMTDQPVTKKMMRLGTQPLHHITDSANSTKTAAPIGDAAIAETQRRVSPEGVKQAAVNAKKAIDKKYPGLYKK